MANGSIKVKRGQKIDAGTPLGKMGTTGMSTGKHLHWELHKGGAHTWNATGAGYIEPVKFFKNLIEWEKSIESAAVEATPEDPTIPTVTYETGKPVVVADPVAEKTEAVAPKTTTPKKVTK
jgi:murein DD-endopeptidase MepM/ murein hydrolase activator NlpD